MKQYSVILPNSGDDHCSQLKDCLKQVKDKYFLNGCKKAELLKITIFFDAVNIDNYKSLKEEFNKLIDNYFQNRNFIVSFIPQPPAENLISTELMVHEASEGEKISLKTYENFEYLVINSKSGIELISNSIDNLDKSAGFSEKTGEGFEFMLTILNSEGFVLSDIFRQWNYIENIYRLYLENKQEKQNYQIFNDIRSQYYSSVDWKNGYPSATGIGMETGGIIIEFIAFKPAQDIIISLQNPLQTDAHKYPESVLLGNSNNQQKTTPKFERAKGIFKANGGTIYISGTAAIEGSQSSVSETVEEQTKQTISNILTLISERNISEHLIPYKSKLKPKDNTSQNGFQLQSINSKIDYLRVYLKKREDIIKTKKILSDSFPEIPKIFLKSDVCRSELLVEIEGLATVIFSDL